jgi:hypothetical protein
MVDEGEIPKVNISGLLGCIAQFLLMGVLSWLFVIGVAWLIYVRWVHH